MTSDPAGLRASSRYRVLVLGPFALEHDGARLDTSAWQRRVSVLFKLVATAPQRRRSRDEIVDILWPAAAPDAGAGNLRLLVHRLRLTLGGDPSPILSERGWIALNPAYEWELDLDRFEELVRSASDLTALEEAAALYRGEPLVEDRYEDWAAPLRERAQRVWRDLCLRLAALFVSRGSREEALRWYERLLDADPLDEEALRGLLTVLVAMGRRTDAERRFGQFEDRLRKDMDAPPSAATLALVERIRGQSDEASASVPSVEAITPESALDRPLPEGHFLGAHPPGLLIAREEEMERILFALDVVESGSGRLILLPGEPGAGKTRVAQEIMLLLRDRGYLVATGRCYERDQGVPFYPFLDILAHVWAAAPSGIRLRASEAWPQLSWLLPNQIIGSSDMASDGVDEQQHLFRAVSSFFGAIAQERPVALLLDDLQWADEASLDLLEDVARRTRGHRVFLLATYRDVDLDRDHPLTRMVRELAREGLVERVPVRRLTPEGTAALVTAMLGEAEGTGEFVDFVHRRTKGNPFYIHKMVRALGGHYRLIRQIGAGGMGRVFEAVDTDTGMSVAAKIMFARTEAEPKALLRFEQEGAVLAGLKHPNIVEVYGTFLEEHASCIIMELLRGHSLGQIMRTEPLSLERIKWLMQQVAAALASAHSQGVAHRDIKPDNIMVVGDDEVKVTDFGIARMLRPSEKLTTLTSAGMTMGTPLYMAPEQIEAKKVDGRADLYSLGAVMYHLVTGNPPFEGEDSLSIAYKHVHESPLPPRSLKGDIPLDWEALILRALAKDPSDRYSSADAMERAIAALNTDSRMPLANSAFPLLDIAGGEKALPVRPRRSPSGAIPSGVAGTRKGRRRVWAAVVSVALLAALVPILILARSDAQHTGRPSPLPLVPQPAGPSGGSGLGQFHGPTGVGLDDYGSHVPRRVYVVDYGNNRVQAFSSAGVPLEQFGSLGSGPDQLDEPTDVAVGPDGNIFVVDYGNRRIQKLTGDGVPLNTIQHWTSSTSGPAEPDAYTSVAVDRSGHIYATDLFHNRIVEFAGDRDNTVKAVWGRLGSGPGEFRTPTGIAVDATGNVYVADRDNNRIEKFSTSGQFLTAWGHFGSARGDFHAPNGVSVDAAGNVYVADTGNNRIVKLSPAGVVLAEWGTFGTGLGHFNQPSGLAVDRQGNIYASDYYNNRLQKLSPIGAPLWQTRGAAGR